MEPSSFTLIKERQTPIPGNRFRCLTKKKRYENKNAATRKLRKYLQTHGRSQQVYFCQHCHGFHLTSQSYDPMVDTEHLRKKQYKTKKKELKNGTNTARTVQCIHGCGGRGWRTFMSNGGEVQ